MIKNNSKIWEPSKIKSWTNCEMEYRSTIIKYLFAHNIIEKIIAQIAQTKLQNPILMDWFYNNIVKIASDIVDILICSRKMRNFKY